MARKSLAGWLDDALRDPDKQSEPAQITLAHATVTSGGHTVLKDLHNIRRLPEDNKPWDADVIGKMFQTKAEVYAQDLDGTQKFVLIVKYKNDKLDADAEHPFNITGDKGFQSLSSYPAHEGGRQALGQDLLLSMARGFFGMMDAGNARYERLFDRMENMLNHSQNENREMFVLLRESAMREAQMKADHQMKVLEYQRSSEERKLILTLAPSLINTIAGREIFPQNTEDTALMNTIALNLPEEMIEKLKVFMPEPIGGLLYDRFTRALREKIAEEKLAQQTAGLLPEGEGGIH